MNDWERLHRQAERYKQSYPPGTRVMLTSCIVTFDANGGSVDKTEQTVYYGQPYGTLPVPTLQYYKFVGWFTEASFGSLSLQLVKEV